MRIAVCQLDTNLARPLPERIERAAEAVRLQAGQDLVLLPELWPSGAFDLAELARSAEPLDGPVTAAMQAAARAAGVWLHTGSFVELAEDGRRHNTSLLIDPTGQIRATYRKLHLFGFSGGETTVLDAGEALVTCSTPFGVVGLATCYDLRFPELFRALLDAGADTVLLPAAWPQRRAEHWQVLIRARAIENQVLFVAGNSVGTQGRVQLAGRSAVIDSWGATLAEAGPDRVETLRVEVDQDAVARTRTDFPVLADRLSRLDPAPR